MFLASCGNSAGNDSAPPPRNPGLYVGTENTPRADTATLASALGWLNAQAAAGGVYLVVLDKDESLGPATLHYTDNQVQITLEGEGGTRTVQLTGTGALFSVGNKVSLKLGNGIKLNGVANNTEALVTINSGGKLEVAAGASITGNKTTVVDRSGIYGTASAVCIISGGEISDNEGTRRSGVHITGVGARFEMTGGLISNNRATNGPGGVAIRDNATGLMTNGEIRGNIGSGTDVNAGGGGLRITGSATFTMQGGAVTQNKVESTVVSGGGGIFIGGYSTMVFTGGTIANNTQKSTIVPSAFNLFSENGSQFNNQSGQTLNSVNGFVCY